jgi:urease accessory protein
MMQTPALLSLVQWLSPAFPTGAFAYSHGMEWAISTGDITGADSAEGWLSDVLRFGAGWQDAVLLACALRGEDVTDHASALAPSRERLAETLDQGRAFARGAAALGIAAPDAPLPVALGHAAASLGLPPAQVIALYLHSFAANLVSVAVRFVPLGQSDGQRILAALHPLIVMMADRAAGAGLEDITASALGADLAAMRHETMPVRIYRT